MKIAAILTIACAILVAALTSPIQYFILKNIENIEISSILIPIFISLQAGLFVKLFLFIFKLRTESNIVILIMIFTLFSLLSFLALEYKEVENLLINLGDLTNPLILTAVTSVSFSFSLAIFFRRKIKIITSDSSPVDEQKIYQEI